MTDIQWFYDSFKKLLMNDSSFFSICSMLCIDEKEMLKCFVDRSEPKASSQFLMAKHTNLLMQKDVAIGLTIKLIGDDVGQYIGNKLVKHLQAPLYYERDGRFAKVYSNSNLDEDLDWFIAACDALKNSRLAAFSNIANYLDVPKHELISAYYGKIRPNTFLQYKVMLAVKMADRFEDLCAVVCSMIGGEMGREMEISLLSCYQDVKSKKDPLETPKDSGLSLYL